MKIQITGSSGFVGQNLTTYLKQRQIETLDFSLRTNNWKNHLDNQALAIIHLAGKAHDLKNVSFEKEYYQVNTDLTKIVFDAFLASEAKVFITLSSVKAVADDVKGVLTEQQLPNPVTHYGKSKLLAEEYIFSKDVPEDKRIYVLRPCMIHGPGNKGNLNLLYRLVSKGLPWPLGAFENKRSFLSIDNLLFVINELIERTDIPSGIYNVTDDDSISTNELIKLIAESQNRNPKIWHLPKGCVEQIAKLGDVMHLPLNSERLHKLTDSYEVSNKKIKNVLGKSLPISSRDGLIKTFRSFQK